MELSQLFPITVDLAIDFPDGTPTGIVLKVVGQDSKQFRAMAKKIAGSLMGREDKPSVDEMEKQGAEMAAACVIGWIGLTEGEQPIAYSHEKAVELMAMPELTFMRQQVEGFVGTRTNFFRKSA